MMNRILSMLLHPMALAAIGFLLLAGLIWWAGPLLSFGGEHPLDGVTERLIALAILLLIFGIVFGWRVWRRRRTNRRLVAGLAAGAGSAEREAQALEQRFTEALKVLSESAHKSGKASWLRRGQFLYELPWYMFVGLPGSGKTTALMNAGLNFPLSGKLGQASVRGVGGTRNCEWWFTDEAVLIDTAGRYTSQDSDKATDAAAWDTFLALLRKSRPRRPLNGVLLTVNIQDLLQQSPADRKDHALKLRMRLQELQERLGVRPPVYVLVTKCDLIAGFHETFGAFGREEREQVWGFSFPYDANDPKAPGASQLQSFGAEFAALGKRLRDSLIVRMQTESDVLRRAAIFAFPQQFEGLKGLLGGFLEQVFSGGGNLEETPLVRGVYFTSGTQEGSPIDRVLGALGRTFGVEQSAPAVPSWRGKAFFLTRLLKEVVFAEQGLVGENRQAESRRRRWRLLGMASMAVGSVVVVAGWSLAYTRNLGYLAEVQTRIPDVQAAVAAVPPANGAELSVLPNALDKLAAVPAPDAFALDAPPLLYTLGLYQGPYVSAGTEIGYRKLLDNALMPRIVRRLEERLRAANRDNLELAYEALKGYMMLYSPEHFDAESFKAWVALDWDANLAATMTAEQRGALAQHLEAAVARGAPRAPAPMDRSLVANVREMLVAYPLEYRIFSRLKRARVGADIPDFTAAGAGGPNAVRVFERASGQPLTKGIPGLFTRDGYFKAFKASIAKVAPLLAAEEGWVLGVTAPPESLKQAAGSLLGAGNVEIETRVRRLYLQEYIKVWDQYIKDVRLVKLGGLERSLAVAGLLAAPDSPLASYLRAVARETQLGAIAAAAVAKSGGPAAVSNSSLSRLSKAKADIAAVVGKATGAEDIKAAGPPLEMMVDDYFSSLHRMVTGTPAPIDETMKLFNEVFVQLTAIDSAQKTKTAPPAGGGGAAAKAAAGMQPEPIKSMLMALADAGASQGRVAERQGLSAEVRPVLDQCAKTIAGRYPFALGSRSDVLPDDFGQMFGVGGQLDDFFQRKLSALVDIGVTPWAYRPLPDGTKPPGGAALADFQRAAKIREAFFRAGGKAPGFKVDLRVLEMDAGVKELVLDIDGQAMKFAAGSTAAQTLTWPSQRVASQVKLSLGGTPQLFEGPWALFRLIGQHEVQASPQAERFTVLLNVDGRKAKLEVISSSALNPLRMREMQAFRCPELL
ncbi:MAG: type VI secretion system membrane subunit TssM [Ideonella sp.]|nr:type VI secretion system membrane subunit TssM [Ideonella sp.]